jgi:hypothetical protein
MHISGTNQTELPMREPKCTTPRQSPNNAVLTRNALLHQWSKQSLNGKQTQRMRFQYNPPMVSFEFGCRSVSYPVSRLTTPYSLEIHNSALFKALLYQGSNQSLNGNCMHMHVHSTNHQGKSNSEAGVCLTPFVDSTTYAHDVLHALRLSFNDNWQQQLADNWLFPEQLGNPQIPYI